MSRRRVTSRGFYDVSSDGGIWSPRTCSLISETTLRPTAPDPAGASPLCSTQPQGGQRRRGAARLMLVQQPGEPGFGPRSVNAMDLDSKYRFLQDLTQSDEGDDVRDRGEEEPMVGDATCDGDRKDSLHDWRESEVSADSRNNSVVGMSWCFICQGHRGNGDEPCQGCHAPSAGSSEVTKVAKSGDGDRMVRKNRRMTWTATLGESESSGVEFHGPGRRLTRCTSLVERPSHRRASLPDICKVARPTGRGDDVQAGPGTAGSSSEARAAGRRVSNDSTSSIRRTESDPSSQRTDRCNPIDGLPGDGDPISWSGTFGGGAPIIGGADGNRSFTACGSPLLGALSHLRKKDNRGNPNASSGWPVSVSPTWGSFSRVAGNESAGRKHIPKISSNFPAAEDEGKEVERASRSSHPNFIPAVSSPCPAGSPNQWFGSWAGPKPPAVSDNPPGSVSADYNTGRDATTANWLGGQERWDALGISLINAKVIASGMLRENTEKISWAMEWTSPSAVLFTSIPLDAMHTRWQFSLLLWVKAVYLCYHASCAATTLYEGTALPISQFRLDISQTRGECSAHRFRAPSIAFSLAGRRISEAKYSVEWGTKGRNGGMPTAVATFAEGVKISAWSFTTAADSTPDCDPWAFSARRRAVKEGAAAAAAAGGEAERGSDARRCGKDDKTCAAGGTCSSSSHNLCSEWVELRQLGWMSNRHLSSDEMLRSGATQVPIERRSEAYFDMSPPISKYCETWCCIIESALSLAAVFSMSVLHKFAVGRALMALAVGCWIPVIVACQPLSFSQLSYESIALLPWCVLTTIGILHQRFFSYCSPIAAVYHAAVTRLSSGVEWSVAEHLRGLGSVIFWAYILVCRFFDKLRAISIVAEDRKEYDEAWTCILQDDYSRKWLARLEKLSNRIWMSCKGKTTHQTMPEADEMLKDYHNRETEPVDGSTAEGQAGQMLRASSWHSLKGLIPRGDRSISLETIDLDGVMRFRSWQNLDRSPSIDLPRSNPTMNVTTAAAASAQISSLSHFSRSRSCGSYDVNSPSNREGHTPVLSRSSSLARIPTSPPKSPAMKAVLELPPPALARKESSTYTTSGLVPEIATWDRCDSAGSVVSDIFCAMEKQTAPNKLLGGSKSSSKDSFFYSRSADSHETRTSSDVSTDSAKVSEGVEGSFANIGHKLAHAESFIRSVVQNTTDNSKVQNKTMCIDELYIHAPFIDFLLRRKIQIWGCKFGGMYRSMRNGFQKWDANAAQDDSDVIWCGIKHLDRSVEKILRVYDGDVSQLLDVCRQCIVFENVRDLHNCLQGIWLDVDVDIVRIKNRLSPSYDSSKTAGYRDVAINIAITPPDMSGVIDTHICEVQLVLKSTSELKSGEGHKRYIEFRNLRGE